MVVRSKQIAPLSTKKFVRRAGKATLSPHFPPALCCAEPKSFVGFVKECISILNV
jgi:hypothetical protein